MSSHALSVRLTRIFKGPGYNPYREKCGRFTTEENAGSECGVEETTPPMSDEELVDFVAEWGPSRLEGVPLVVENLTKNDYEAALATLSDEMQEVVDILEKPDMILESEYGSYNMLTKAIRANMKNEGMTFKHEYGHHVDKMLAESRDYARTWSSLDDKFFRAFEQDRIAAGFLDPNDNLLRQEADSFLDNSLFTPMGTRRFQDPGTIYLEDIADAISVGKLSDEFGLRGHGKEYFVNRPDRQYEETFANMFALHGNERAWESVKKMVPRAAKVFEDKMKEVRR